MAKSIDLGWGKRWFRATARYRVLLALLTPIILLANGAPARAGEPETDQLKIGFIKLTDMAPLAIAKEKFYFEDEDLQVLLEAQANWKVLLDRVITGELDGAHMLAGQPLAATIGYGTKADVITAFSMDLNGNAITVSNDIFEEMKKNMEMGPDGKPKHPISAKALKPVVDRYRDDGKPFNMGMVFPVSTHNYELRYWLAAGGIRPGFYSRSNTTGQIQADVLLSVTPPPQMPATLEAGTILGYCVGEPWNQAAVFKGVGVPIITDHDIWKFNPEKVFGVSAKWADENPNTHLAVIKALIRAGIWLDDPANRAEAVKILSQPRYVGADEEVIASSMTGSFEYEKGDKRPAPEFNVFFKHFATYPFYSDAIWYLTQMRRWGQIGEGKSDSWYVDVAMKVYKPDIYMRAAEELIAEGKAKKEDFPFGTDGFKPPTAEFIDGIEYDGKKPNEYLSKFPIGLKDNQKVAGQEVVGG
jgi:nitrate/nitrite transport system substrate-binding protein